VVVAEVTKQEVAETSRLVGIVDFDRVSAVSGEIAGLITRQHVNAGSRVNAGDPLVELNTDFVLKDMDIKRKQREQVSADIQKVGSTLKRLESLLQSNSASRQTYDDALYDHRSLKKKRESLDQELERLGLQLDKSTIKAPFDGIVLEKLKERGEWIDPGTPVCQLASIHDVIVKVAISENLVRLQKPEEPMSITIDALGLQVEGRIRGIVPVAELRSKSATLKVAIPFSNGMIQNMSAAADILSSEKRSVHLLPRDAVVRRADEELVYTVSEGKAVPIPVEILIRQGDQVGVDPSQLAAGTLVVVDGNDRLRPDQPVQIVQR
jgi:RND family efflux transporter MFP subunit